MNKPIDDEFTERDVRKMLTNPVYVGIGRYPRMIEDDMWIKAAQMGIKEHGNNFWLDLQTNVIEFLGISEERVFEICEKAKSRYSNSAEDALMSMLKDLRRETQKKIVNASR